MSNRVKIRMEFDVKTSPTLLFNYISTPSGLSSWFCNDVDIYNNKYKFKWDGEENTADLLKKLNTKLMKFKWLNSAADEYFEFEIVQDELTDDVALVITDYVDAGEENNASKLWESQVHDLKAAIGA